MVNYSRQTPRQGRFEANVDTARNLPGFEASGQPAAAMRSLAGDFSQLATQVNSWADDAARQEGRRAGEVDGAGDGYQPRRDNTIFGNAYDAAGNRAYLLGAETKARQELMEAALRHGEDPAAMKQAADAIRQRYVNASTIPELRGDLDATIQRLGDSYVFQSGKEHRAKQERNDREGFALSIGQQRAEAVRMATGAAGDPKLGERLTQARARVVTEVQGRADLSPLQKQRLIDDYDLSVVGATVEGQIEAIKDPAQLQRFAERAEADWKAKAGAIGQLDDRTFAGVKEAIRRRGVELARGQQQAARDLDLSLNQIEQRVLAGDAIAPGRFAAATARLTRDDPTGEAAERLRQLADLQDWGRGFRTISLGDQRATLKAFDERAARAGLSAGEEQRRTLARAIVGQREKDQGTDPLGTAGRHFGVTIADLDFAAAPDAFREQAGRRVAEAERFAREQAMPVSYLKAADRDRLKQLVEADPANAVRIGSQILAGFGPQKATAVLREISADMPGLAFVLRPGDPQLAADWLRAENAQRAGAKAAPVAADAVRQIFTGEKLHELFEGRPNEMAGLIEAARPLIAQRLGPTAAKFDPEEKAHRKIAHDTLMDLVGRQRDVRAGRDIAGPVRVNGWTTRAPSNVPSDMFGRIIGVITQADLDAAGIKALDASGRPLPIGEITGARWHPAGKDRYRLAVDPSLKSANPWAGGPDGQPLEVDLSPASPLMNRLRERAPRLFR